MSTTTLIYTLAKSSSTQTRPSGLSGFMAVFTVTEAVNINANIFVRQREVAVTGQDNFIDSFYTVASVADMAALPIGFSSMDDPFYRDSTITLVFPSIEEMDLYVGKIQTLIEKLRKANDLAINMLSPQTIGLPDDQTLLRYWGVSVGTTVTDGDLHGFDIDDVYSKTKTIAFVTDAPRYLYFAYRDELGAAGAVTVNSVSHTPVLLQRAVVSQNGYSHAYRIYRTTTTFSGATTVVFP